MNKVQLIECPKCGNSVSINSIQCPTCELNVKNTLENAREKKEKKIAKLIFFGMLYIILYLVLDKYILDYIKKPTGLGNFGALFLILIFGSLLLYFHAKVEENFKDHTRSTKLLLLISQSTIIVSLCGMLGMLFTYVLSYDLS